MLLDSLMVGLMANLRVEMRLLGKRSEILLVCLLLFPALGETFPSGFSLLAILLS